MILDDLVAATQQRTAREQQAEPIAAVKQRALATPAPDPEWVRQALGGDQLSVIAEVKQASPSKGTIVTGDFDPVKIAQAYAAAGVNAISVLTEPDYFHGQLAYLAAIAQRVDVPLLRKDFTINDYMIYQARAAGANLILLIVAILTPAQLAADLQLAHDLGLMAIVEAHDAQEIRAALAAGAQIIGVNNRNLKDFTVDLNNSVRLRALVPSDVLFVAESGIKTAADVAVLRQAGVDAVLIGETLMRAPDKRAALNSLLGGEAQ